MKLPKCTKVEIKCNQIVICEVLTQKHNKYNSCTNAPVPISTYPTSTHHLQLSDTHQIRYTNSFKPQHTKYLGYGGFIQPNTLYCSHLSLELLCSQAANMIVILLPHFNNTIVQPNQYSFSSNKPRTQMQMQTGPCMQIYRIG